MSKIRSAIIGALQGVRAGLTTGEIADLLPDHDWKKVSQCISNMAYNKQLVRHDGETRKLNRYTLNVDKLPTPRAAAPAKKKRGRKAKRVYRIKATTRTDALAVGANATQIGGNHYRNKAVQPWDAMGAWFTPDEFRGFLKGNAIKYLARSNDKGGVEDLRKARHYLDKLLETQA